MSIITVDWVLTRENLVKMGDRSTRQLAKMNIDPKFVQLTADVVRIML